MAAADYRLMTEATGQRIATALEALSGTSAAAAAARANLDVYSTQETDDLIAQSTANFRIKTYTSVTQLGLTAGSATILSAFNAMPAGSILVAEAYQFVSTELPNTMGVVEIVRGMTNGRSYLHFYSKSANGGDHRMFLGATSYNDNDSNAPDGVWHAKQYQ